jgi:methylmalonyl-CoA mutase N-terminal domain/subunit
VAFQALAAVLGGTQSLHANGKDEALALPTEETARLALRTQQIIAAESGVINTTDPVGGSYVIEALTEKIESEARDYISKIESMGGAIAAIESGYIQNEIQAAAYTDQQAIEKGQQVIVGVNKYQTEERTAPQILRVDPQLEDKQKARLAKVKASRSTTAVQGGLAALAQAARGKANLMPYIIDVVQAYATLGEISNTLRTVFGEYQDQNRI